MPKKEAGKGGLRKAVKRATKALFKKSARKKPSKVLDELVSRGPKAALRSAIRKKPRKKLMKAVKRTAKNKNGDDSK